MPLVSVKLPEHTKAKVAQLAARRGVTAHAVMVQAIETAVESAERYDQFVADATASQASVQRSGQVFDGAEFAAYLRAKVSGDAQAVKPPARLLMDFVPSTVSAKKV